MVRVLLQADIAGKLASLARDPGPRLLVVPAGFLQSDGLREFLRREQRGYHEAERAATLEQRQTLIRAFEAAERTGAAEFDDRTDDPIETPSSDLVPLRRAIDDADQRIAAHDAALRALDLPNWAVTINTILDQYDIVDAGADATATVGPDALVVEFTTQGYADLTDPEARQVWRKILRGEPFDDEEGADADDP